MTDVKEQSDIGEIFDKVDVLSGKARLIRDKAFKLRSMPSVEDTENTEKCSETLDFASDIKSRLGTIEGNLDEAVELLTYFVG